MKKENIPTAYIILSGERLITFPLRSETKLGCPSHHLFSILYWKFQPGQWCNRKNLKGIQIGKEEVKLFPFANAMILYIELPIHIHTQNLIGTNK